MDRMKELVSILNEAALSYYRDSKEIMSNFEYDKLYDELKSLEEDMGITLSNSPTVRVGSEMLSALPKEAHKIPLLSLNKTKKPEELLSFLSDKEGLLSVKLDGLTVALTYDKGELLKAVTRGNGETGEVITENAKAFMNLPLRIPFKKELLLRGEAVISYSDFKSINEKIGDIDAKYKNPRNLASGSVRQLNPQITRDRMVNFYGFSLASAEGRSFSKRSEQLLFLKDQGFSLAEFKIVNKDSLEEELAYFHHMVTESDLPSDGLVLGFEDLEYGRSLGATSKFPKDAIAFKWEDEVATTHLKEIIWNASRTGLINPIASFEPVELEGTTVKRASVHNVSILRELGLSKGDEITVYKANMIIPQVLDNLTRGGHVEIPESCPSCSHKAVLKKDKDVEVLICINPHCPAKEIKSYELLTSRAGLNIEGLSEATLIKLIGEGLIHKPKDIFTLAKDSVKKDKFLDMEGFGEKSWNNLTANIEKSRTTTASRLLYSLGISGIGSANAKVIANKFGSDFTRLMKLTEDQLKEAEGIGDILAEGYVEFFKDEGNRNKVEGLLEELIIERKEAEGHEVLKGISLAVTGNLSFGSRDEFKEYVEGLGGKVVSAVSKNTDYLVNNESSSLSSKNVKARELGVKVITEEDFLNIVNEMTKE